MIPSAHLREQQARARKLSRQILRGLDAYRTRDDAFAIVLDIARMTGILAIHFAQVDRSLLPRLCEGDDEVRRAAIRFREEFCGLADLVKLFNSRWCTSAAVAADPVAFRVDVQQLVYAVEERFDREERDLFKANDRGRQPVEMGIPAMRPPVASPSAA